jgi:hypothetical protein
VGKQDGGMELQLLIVKLAATTSAAEPAPAKK